MHCDSCIRNPSEYVLWGFEMSLCYSNTSCCALAEYQEEQQSPGNSWGFWCPNVCGLNVSLIQFCNAVFEDMDQWLLPLMVLLVLRGMSLWQSHTAGTQQIKLWSYSAADVALREKGGGLIANPCQKRISHTCYMTDQHAERGTSYCSFVSSLFLKACY